MKSLLVYENLNSQGYVCPARVAFRLYVESAIYTPPANPFSNIVIHREQEEPPSLGV